MEKGEADIMKRKPRDAGEGIFAGGLGVHVVLQGVSVALITMAAYLVGHYMEAGVWEFTDSADGMTMAFLTLSMAEIFHSFNMRSLKKSLFSIKGQNKFLWGAMLLSLICTTAVIYVPFLSNAFGFTSISPMEYLVSILIAAFIIPLVELTKLLQRMLTKSVKKS